MSVRNLFRNIQSHAFYNVCLLSAIAILSVILFGSVVIGTSLANGTENMKGRLGADIMLVPRGAKEKAENMLLEGQRGAFYFESSIYDGVAGIEGITKITSQSFLKSLSADCCSSEVEIVFFDPETDFVVAPWIEQEYEKNLSGERVVVGHNIDSTNGVIRLFGRDYQVVSQMAKTGTALDSSVYFAADVKGEILKTAEEKGSFLTDDQKRSGTLSSIFIIVSDGYDIGRVIEDAHRAVGDTFDVVYPKQLNESLGESLGGITGGISVIAVSLGILLATLMLIINSILMNRRKQDIALMRILGKTKKDLVRMLVSELGIISLAGAVTGCLLGALVVLPFGTYIGMSLNMPYLGPGPGATIGVVALIIVGAAFIVFLTSIVFILRISGTDPYLALRREE